MTTSVANITAPYVLLYAATGDHAGRYATLAEAQEARIALACPEGEAAIVQVDPFGNTVDWH